MLGGSTQAIDSGFVPYNVNNLFEPFQMKTMNCISVPKLTSGVTELFARGQVRRLDALPPLIYTASPRVGCRCRVTIPPSPLPLSWQVTLSPLTLRMS